MIYIDRLKQWPLLYTFTFWSLHSFSFVIDFDSMLLNKVELHMIGDEFKVMSPLGDDICGQNVHNRSIKRGTTCTVLMSIICLVIRRSPHTSFRILSSFYFMSFLKNYVFTVLLIYYYCEPHTVVNWCLEIGPRKVTCMLSFYV